MGIPALFGLSILLSFVAFGLVTRLFLWPRLRVMARDDALLPLVVPHTIRFIGLSFLVPGVVSPALPSAFAAPAAYGDLVATLLAIAASLALFRRARLAIALVWLFNVWGGCRFPPRVLPGADHRATRCQNARRRVLHSDRIRAGGTHHPWPDILAACSTKGFTLRPEE
jgi:hypothetical protein